MHPVFIHQGKELYMNIYGEAYISIEQECLEELWSSDAEAWFNKGKNDPS